MFRRCSMSLFESYPLTISMILILFVIGWILHSMEGNLEPSKVPLRGMAPLQGACRAQLCVHHSRLLPLATKRWLSGVANRTKKGLLTGGPFHSFRPSAAQFDLHLERVST